MNINNVKVGVKVAIVGTGISEYNAIGKIEEIRNNGEIIKKSTSVSIRTTDGDLFIIPCNNLLEYDKWKKEIETRKERQAEIMKQFSDNNLEPIPKPKRKYKESIVDYWKSQDKKSKEV